MDAYLCNRARVVIELPALPPRAVPSLVVAFEWNEEDDELFERMSTAKKQPQESRVVMNEILGEGTKQRSLARVLNFSGGDVSDGESDEEEKESGEGDEMKDVEIAKTDLMDLERIDASFDE